MHTPPRVALFADSFHEVNGLALTARALDAFARRRGLPFLSVRGGPAAGGTSPQGADSGGGALDLPRSRASIPLDVGLAFDPFWMRHARVAARALDCFSPDIIHITGANDMGQLGAWLAWRRGVPLVASWHTNIHEFAGRRLDTLLRGLPAALRHGVARAVERTVWKAAMQFYRMPRALLAPSPVLVDALRAATGRPVFLMRRGIDHELFTPARRERHDGTFRLGFVGRLAPEKNVRALAALEHRLLERGASGFDFVIVGQGRERPWLEGTMTRAVFPGVLRDEALAHAYAQMDVFVFPSETDTFGNVVLEALASGVPVIVTDRGGPQSIIRPGVDGIVVSDVRGMADAVAHLMSDRETHARMRTAARARALEYSWDEVFGRVYQVYADIARQVPPEERGHSRTGSDSWRPQSR
jgi:phosphatidylinositol alpha 1,6-mannosyltransferase